MENQKTTLQKIWGFLTSSKGLVGILKDNAGKFSSKRSGGLTLIIIGYNGLTGGATDPYQIISYSIITLGGAALLAFTSFEKIKTSE